MASDLATMKDKLTALSIVTLLSLGFTQSAAAQTAKAPDPEPFTWSAELVAYDAAANTITLKSYIDTRVDRAALADLAEGDPITIGWTGLNWGAGIASVAEGWSSNVTTPLRMPAELVGTEIDEQYLVYRMPVPEAAGAALQAIEPGTWVTATSPRDAETPDRAITAIRAYNDVD